MATLEIHNGDCLEVMKGLAANSIDLFLCDLPYGCLSLKETTGLMRCEPGREHIPRNDNTNVRGCAWDIKIDLEKFWEQVKRLRRNEHTPCLMFCNTRFGYELIKSNEKEFRYDIVWEKPLGVGFLLANKQPLRSHEMIYVFSKAGAYYTRIDILGDFKKTGGGRNANQKVYGDSYEAVHNDNTGKRCVKSVQEFANPRTKGGHPTEKPMELYKWLIERYCPAGGVVLDPTAGSCNSVVAAFELDRSGIGIEKDTTFYAKAAKRLDDLTEKLTAPEQEDESE